MTAQWDDLAILRVIDRMQREIFGGGPLATYTGLTLMETVNGGSVAEHQRWRGFVQELRIARDQGFLVFRERPDPTPNVAEVNPHWYLQTISDFALTVSGQDRARGLVVMQPAPDPEEDDGSRRISSTIFRQVAAAITSEYTAEDIAELLDEESLLPAALPLVDPATQDTYLVLTSLWRWGSDGRRRVRRFIGRWLDDRLLIGPDPDLRAGLIEQLARQGWRVRETDAVLVSDDPVKGIPAGAPFLRSSRLHSLIEAEARPQFLIGKPEQGVFAAMRAVEIRVRRIAGLGSDSYGVALMNQAFGKDGPLTDPAAGKGEQEGMRALFAGSYAVLRNPAGHREVDYGDVSEAAEAVQTASLMMRLLDHIEFRLDGKPG